PCVISKLHLTQSAHYFLNWYKQAAEKRLFCALRASLRQLGSLIFQTYGTTESRALIQGFTHKDFFRTL
ncbi:MAG: hypothetical protein DMG67_11410, partial [Acidobacteria bacterium]